MKFLSHPLPYLVATFLLLVAGLSAASLPSGRAGYATFHSISFIPFVLTVFVAGLGAWVASWAPIGDAPRMSRRVANRYVQSFVFLALLAIFLAWTAFWG